MRRHVASAVFTAVALTTACDVPTSVPNWDMTWNFPASSVSIPVASILPNGVSLTPSGAAFQANVNAVTITRTLAQDCPTCATGVAAPKPAYSSSVTSSPVSLPAGVTLATLITDTVYVTMVNRYQFDPINPGGGAAGAMTFVVSSGAATLGTLSLSGPVSSIPANGATTTVKIPVTGTVSSAGVSLRVDVNSPQGSTITLSNPANQQFTYTARIGGSAQGPVIASSASVSLTSQIVRPSPTDYKLDFGSADKADSALVFLTLSNPFNLTGTLNVNFLGCGDGQGNFFDSCQNFTILVSRQVPVASGTTTVTLHFGTPGTKALLNAKQISFGGTVSGTTPITPRQVVDVSTRFQLTMHTGSQ
ncbi:MAG TPA: hypothetical protein VI259_05795 [Gemmatimonadaceae bacterium]